MEQTQKIGRRISKFRELKSISLEDLSTRTGLDVEILKDRALLKIIDILGRETKSAINSPLFYIYDDGTVEKKIVVE